MKSKFLYKLITEPPTGKDAETATKYGACRQPQAGIVVLVIFIEVVLCVVGPCIAGYEQFNHLQVHFWN